ncbi:MAG TPA: hypothetical protein VGD77_13615 [Gemmatimonadaceae bacterium]
MMFPSDLPHLVDVILTKWRAALRHGPGLPAREDERGAAERQLVRALVDAGLKPHDDVAIRSLAIAAAEFGALEPMREVDPGKVLRSLDLLRATIWAMLTEEAPASRMGFWRDATNYILAIDEALSVATRAAMSSTAYQPGGLLVGA